MNTHDHPANSVPPSSQVSQGRHGASTRRSIWVFGGFVAIVLLMLAVEHRVHLVAWLPWIVLAACPLMHLFMHGGDGGQGGHGDGAKPGADK